MARYGAKYIKFAPFAAKDPEASKTAYPHYGTPVSLGALNKLTDSPSLNEAKIYGDDELNEYVAEFKECPIDIETPELPLASASVVLGATLGTGTSGGDTDLRLSTEDNAPYGGLAFYCTKLVHNVKVYQGIYYPKVKASVQGEEYDTKGDSITFATDKLHFVASACLSGEWKVKSSLLTSESAAEAWVDAKIKEYNEGDQ